VSGISRDTCKASAGTLTSICRDAFVRHQTESAHQFGSGTGTRTLNLAVNRSAEPLHEWRSGFAECWLVPPNIIVCHRRRCMPTRAPLRVRRVRHGRRPSTSDSLEDSSLSGSPDTAVDIGSTARLAARTSPFEINRSTYWADRRWLPVDDEGVWVVGNKPLPLAARLPSD